MKRRVNPLMRITIRKGMSLEAIEALVQQNLAGVAHEGNGLTEALTDEQADTAAEILD